MTSARRSGLTIGTEAMTASKRKRTSYYKRGHLGSFRTQLARGNPSTTQSKCFRNASEGPAPVPPFGRFGNPYSRCSHRSQSDAERNSQSRCIARAYRCRRIAPPDRRSARVAEPTLVCGCRTTPASFTDDRSRPRTDRTRRGEENSTALNRQAALPTSTSTLSTARFTLRDLVWKDAASR